MNETEIKQSLLAELPGSRVELVAEGNKISLRITSAAFEGLNRVKRQQLVYAVLNDKISSGEIHAVSMLCQTPAEVAEQNIG